MKKNYFRVLIILVLIFTIGVITYQKIEEKKPVFEIMSTIKSSFGDKEDVLLQVKINVKEYDKEVMLDDIYKYYTGLAGEPDETHIKIYDGKKEYDAGLMSASKVYYKE